MGWFEISRHCTKLRNGYQLIWEYFQKVLIPTPSESLREQIASTAEELTKLVSEREQLPLEDKLNQLVYQAFDLTSEEIALIENSGA